ncbi:MAG: FAD-binding oxidoreductase, partial [Woeseiaceae bacterium]|nr:FAD-binding oxidoreductase [Woeseiaceae bacterium]
MTKRYEKQEHTASYYAATASLQTDYPPLEGAHSTDVCIVGAGFTGVSTALTLAERGYSVAVVEANRIGWGASGRNGGQLINGISGLHKIRQRYGDGVADVLWDLRWRGNHIVRDRIEKYGIECDLKDGFVEVAVKERQLAMIDAYAADMEQHDAPYRYAVWDRDQTRQKLGTDKFLGGFVSYFDGHLHPLNLCIGEARAAESLGVRFFEQSPVTRIDHGNRPRVHTDSGSIEADAVVLAGNAYGWLEPQHLSNLVFPAGSYIIATEPLPESLAAEI